MRLLQFYNQPCLQTMQTCSYLIKISTNYLMIWMLSCKNMSIWHKTNKLNLTKTKWTLFHSQKKKRLTANDLPILYLDNFEIVRESITKFLGIFIDENLTWKYHIEHLCNKVSKRIGIMYKSRNILSIFHLFIATWTMQILLGPALTN